MKYSIRALAVLSMMLILLGVSVPSRCETEIEVEEIATRQETVTFKLPRAISA